MIIGYIHFANRLSENGGTDRLVNTDYGRNLWAVMSKFNVLPTDPRFQDLTVEQLNYIIGSIVQDNKEATDMANGVKRDIHGEDTSYDYYGELVLPSEEEDARSEAQVNEMIELKRSRIEYKIENGIELTNEDLHTQEALMERDKKLEEFYKMLEVMERTGISYDDYQLYGESGSSNIEMPMTVTKKQVEDYEIDSIVSAFDDEFSDLT